jgi:hypothetical protein
VELEAEFALITMYFRGGHGIAKDLVLARKLLIR